jgi:hypothetical protein
MRRVFGRTALDPAARMSVGAEMVFRPETFPTGSPPGEYTVDNLEHFQGVLLQVMVLTMQQCLCTDRPYWLRLALRLRPGM